MHPGFAMVVVSAGERILSAQKRASNAARDAVIDADFSLIEDLATSISGHSSTSETFSSMYICSQCCQEEVGDSLGNPLTFSARLLWPNAAWYSVGV